MKKIIDTLFEWAYSFKYDVNGDVETLYCKELNIRINKVIDTYSVFLDDVEKNLSKKKSQEKAVLEIINELIESLNS